MRHAGLLLPPGQALLQRGVVGRRIGEHAVAMGGTNLVDKNNAAKNRIAHAPQSGASLQRKSSGPPSAKVDSGARQTLLHADHGVTCSLPICPALP